MKKGQKKRVWTKEQKLEIIGKHLDEHISVTLSVPCQEQEPQQMIQLLNH